jgi:hypothetical protein
MKLFLSQNALCKNYQYFVDSLRQKGLLLVRNSDIHNQMI